MKTGQTFITLYTVANNGCRWQCKYCSANVS